MGCPVEENLQQTLEPILGVPTTAPTLMVAIATQTQVDPATTTLGLAMGSTTAAPQEHKAVVEPLTPPTTTTMRAPATPPTKSRKTEEMNFKANWYHLC